MESSDVPEELKAKELEIVDDQNLSTPEVVFALAKLIGEEADKVVSAAGIAIPSDNEVEAALKNFESESAKAEEDLESDMKLVDENLQAIKEASEEIQKAALQEGLKADS